MNYKQFESNMKEYLNMAMNIYATIQYKNLTIKVDFVENDKHIYELTDFDKKIVSLFIAGYMANSILKQMMEDSGIKLKDMLKFIKTNKFFIKKLPNEKYEYLYKTQFSSVIKTILNSDYLSYDINKITPEVIFGSLDRAGVDEVSFIMYKFLRKCFKEKSAKEESLFKQIKEYNLLYEYINLKDYSKNDNISNDNESSKKGQKDINILTNGIRNFKLYGNFPSTLPNDITSLLALKKELSSLVTEPEEKHQTKIEKNIEQVKEKKSNGINLNDESIWLLLEEIQKKFIGQEIASEGLFCNIVNNQKLALTKDLKDGQRSIIFLDGPTGTGKTAITREITDKLDIPFVSTSVTNYSSTGYVGGDLTDLLKELYNKSNGDIEKAQRGIIVLDEFDKIAYSRSGGLEMKRAVQQQLLDFLGGGKYKIRIGDNILDRREIEFDTSKITFICLGALTNLREQKTEIKQAIGFEQSSSTEHKQEENYTITPQDLVGIGLERELVGRFNTYLHTDDYSKENLLKILKESTISPIVAFKEWVESSGKKIEIDEEVYEIIAKQAYELNTGARSLQTVINNIRTHFIKDVLRGNDETIYLDSETILKITGQIMNRKGRA